MVPVDFSQYGMQPRKVIAEASQRMGLDIDFFDTDSFDTDFFGGDLFGGDFFNDEPSGHKPGGDEHGAVTVEDSRSWQGNLFDSGFQRIQHARHLLSIGRVDDACDAYHPLIGQGANGQGPRDADPDRKAEAERILELRAALASALARPIDERFAALIAIVDNMKAGSDGDSKMLDQLGRLIVRFVVDQAQSLGGPDTPIAGLPLAHYLLDIGDLGEAQALLDQADDDAHAFVRADLLYLCDKHAPARMGYRRALLFHADEAGSRYIRDPEVRELVDVAAEEFEREDPALAWAVAAGMVQKVLPRSTSEHELAEVREMEQHCAQGPSRQGYQFIIALMEASLCRAAGDRKGEIAARRAMKRLCPAMLAVYKEDLT